MHLITTTQAAILFHVTPRTIQSWCKSKVLPSLRIKGTTRILADELPMFIKGFNMEMLSPQSNQTLAYERSKTVMKTAA